MNSIKEINRISELISRWSAEVSINNQRGDFSINKKSEYLAQAILNILFDYDLINLNEINDNYPAIDLGDENSGIAFQVTTSVDSSELRKRIKKRIKDFYEKELNLKFRKGIYFFILSDRPINFDTLDDKERNFSSKNIITLATLVKEIEKIYNKGIISKIKKIQASLESEFSDNLIDNSENEKPSIIVGLCLDLSKSMKSTIDLLPEKNDLSKENWKFILDSFLNEIIGISNAPGLNTLTSLFTYGYGFSNSIAQLHGLVNKIGIKISDIDSDKIPSKNTRDLLEMSDTIEKRIPNTPNLISLRKHVEKYKTNFLRMYFDSFKGEQDLFECLIEVKNRIRIEKDIYCPQYMFLILVTNGKVKNNDYKPIHDLCREIEKQNVAIISLCIDQDDILKEKTLYNEISNSWQNNAVGLFHCATTFDYSNPILENISNKLVEKNWNIPADAKLFFQLNHSRIIHDILTSIINNKYSNA